MLLIYLHQIALLFVLEYLDIYNITTVYNVVDSMQDCDRYVFRDKICFGEREYDYCVWWEAWQPWY